MMSDSIWDLVAGRPPAQLRIYGVVAAVVTNTVDPEKLGRVKVRFLWLADTDESEWARVAVPLAGKEYGAWMIPQVDDEVLVAFEQGSTALPYVVGSLWSETARPPKGGADGGSGVAMLHSRGGHVVRLDDREGEQTIEIRDAAGNSIVLRTGDNAITLTCQGDLTLESKGGRVVVKAAKGVDLAATGDEAGVDVSATGGVTVKGKSIDLN